MVVFTGLVLRTEGRAGVCVCVIRVFRGGKKKENANTGAFE